MSDKSEIPALAIDQTKYPDALSPSVKLTAPNSPVDLYDGQIDFTVEGKTVSADARIVLNWLPAPSIRFDVPTLPEAANQARLMPGGACQLGLNDGLVISHGIVTGIHSAS